MDNKIFKSLCNVCKGTGVYFSACCIKIICRKCKGTGKKPY